jgi:hypothetical protein
MDTAISTRMRTATVDEAERAVAVLVLAFSTDPVARWSFPDPHQYLTYFPAVVRAFGNKAFARGSAHHAGEFAGAALWLPPGVLADEDALGAAMQAGVSPQRQPEVFGLFERMAGYREHAPAYLESTNPANLPLYQRHGFETLDIIQEGSSPPLFPMLRPAG